jgi:nucleoid DNA-binding protein/cell division septation protein DedD
MILNLSNFIYSLLLENETVILPGFGAFISTYKPAEIGENEIKPPSNEISFTQQIKNNDGLLVEIIARKAKISQGNALKRIEKARENMFYELDKGNTVILENIGSLKYDKNNEIVFEPVQDNNFLIDAFGLETITTKDVAKTTNVNNIPEKGKSESEQIISVAAVADSSDKKLNLEKETKTKTGNDNDLISKDFKFPEFKPAPVVQEEEESKKFAWYWYLLILIPILIGVYFVIMNQSKPTENEFNNTKASIEQEQNITAEKVESNDSLKNETKVTEEISPSTSNTVQQPEITNQSEIGKFYLIRGGFEEEENVREYMAQLKAEGVESFVAGKTGRLILVGIEKFDTEEDAMKALNSYARTKPDWKLWVFKAK